MATQICPKCKQDSFTWSLDENEISFTRWDCYTCGYIAWEEEKQERICSDCGKKTESPMNDIDGGYWWCSSCNKITIPKK